MTIMQLEKELQDYQQSSEEKGDDHTAQPLPAFSSIAVPYSSYEDFPDHLEGRDNGGGEGEDQLGGEDTVAEVLQQMIDHPEQFNLDTIDDVSFPGKAMLKCGQPTVNTGLSNLVECGFTDQHMLMFTQFLLENEFPSLRTIDVSSRPSVMSNRLTVCGINA